MAEANPMVKPNVPRVMMGRGGYLSNEERIKKDEAEFEAMKKAALGITDEESTEDKPSSEEPEAKPVQAESNTEQKEEPKAEAQEDDSELSTEEKNFKKRYGDLRRHSQKKEEEFNAKIAALEAKLDKASKQELVLPKSDEELEAWAKKYPDVAGIVEAIAAREADKKASDLNDRMAEFEELRHPDFAQIREDDAFHKWAEQQPKWVQDALYENTEDAKSVARVIDLYKVDTGITTKKTSNDKAAASSVKTKGAAKPEPDEASKYIKESDVAAMSIREYEKRQEEILDAQRNGRFIYDMSRK
jgi:hypothetical protein